MAQKLTPKLAKKDSKAVALKKAADELIKKSKLAEKSAKAKPSAPVKGKGGKADAGKGASAAVLNDMMALAREKLKKRGKGENEVDGDELEEQASTSMLDAEVDPEAEKENEDGEPLTERKEVKDLLETAKAKGHVTVEEVNDALPGDVVSADQIDDVMSMFGDNEV